LKNIKLQESKLITGIADMLQIYVRYALDCKKKQIQFNFKIINMTLFMIENVSIDLEANQSMSAVPYPITSKSLFIKSMSTR